MRRALLALLAPALLAAPAAADLAKIDRSLKKEPAYKGQPRYLLLAFGDKAQHRAWLVHDGDTLYVDRNGDGDLTGQGEKVARTPHESRAAEEAIFEVGELRVGGKVHKALTVDFFRLKGDPLGLSVRLSLDVHHTRLKSDRLGGRVSMGVGPSDDEGRLRFAASAREAPIIHFDGPLRVTFAIGAPQLALGRSNEVELVVGARGQGPGTGAALAYEGTIPDTAHPRAEIEWPAAKPGGKVVRQYYELKERC